MSVCESKICCKRRKYAKKNSENIWSFQKKVVPLHSQKGNNTLLQCHYVGSLAQLNRASDYGSEGCRFESCRSHKLKACDTHCNLRMAP